MSELPFDRIVLGQGAASRTLNVDEFFKLPLGERVRAILSRHVQFFSGKNPVDTNVALRILRERAL